MKNEIWLETVHGRRNKGKTQFKAVVEKVLVSSLVLATLVGTSAPAFAVEQPIHTQAAIVSVAQASSLESTISEIKNTLAAIQAFRSNGRVTDENLSKLASQLYRLEQSVKGADSNTITEVNSLLDQAEGLVKDIDSEGAIKAKAAIQTVRTALSSTKPQTVTQLKSFDDLSQDHWAYSAIMDSVKRGLIKGTREADAAGVGSFNPTGVMSKAEFVTIVTRYLYPEEVKMSTIPNAEWWRSAYNVAVSHKIIKNSEFPDSTFTTPMTREEMALVLIRTAEEKGEVFNNTVATSQIPDYNNINPYYSRYALQAYSAGLIQGKGNNTFDPQGTLTRAEAAMVAYRLTNPSARTPMEKKAEKGFGDNRFDPTDNHQEWVEGQPHDKPKVGDVVIKVDGTRVVLEATQMGDLTILGYGVNGPQGVDPYTGTKTEKGSLVGIGGLAWFDLSPFVKDEKITGSVFTRKEWIVIMRALYPQRVGSYDGEMENIWYRWDAEMGEWFWQGSGIQ